MVEERRCSVCGKVIDAGSKVVQIELGTLTAKGVQLGKSWGLTHASCFNRAMPTPKAALAEIKRLAREGRKAAV